MAENLEHEHEHEHGATEAVDGSQQPLVITPKAVEMVRKMRDKEGLDAVTGLRVAVVGGGCSGFSYSLSFDSNKEGDTILEHDGVRVFIDEISLPYIAGTTLDYVEGLHGAGFKFSNPRAARTCGCGSSFSV